MKAIDILDAIGGVDHEYITEKAAPAKRTVRKAAWRWAAAAAAFVIIAVGAFAMLNRQADDVPLQQTENTFPQPTANAFVRPPDTETCYRVEPTENGEISDGAVSKALTNKETVKNISNIIRCKVTAIDEYALTMMNTSFDRPPVRYDSILTCKVTDSIYGNKQNGETILVWYGNSSHQINSRAQKIEVGGEYILLTKTFPEPVEGEHRFDYIAQSYDYMGSSHYAVFRFDENGKVVYDKIFGDMNGQAEKGTIIYQFEEGNGYCADYELIKAELLDLMAERDGAAPPAATATPVPIEISTPAPETSEKPIEKND